VNGTGAVSCKKAGFFVLAMLNLRVLLAEC